MTEDRTKEDLELDIWREQWHRVATPSQELRRKALQRIKVQERRFLLGNVLTAVVFVGMLTYAVFLSHQASRLRRGEAIGLFFLLLVAVTCRLWIMRGTWRAETRSIHAFIELGHRRVLAQIRALQIGIYISIGWLVFCAALAAANWTTIRFELMAHPVACLALTVFVALMQPVLFLGAMWLRRRRVAELNQVTRLLEEMETMND